MITFTEFKSFIIKATLENPNAGFDINSLTEKDYENLYKDNCINEIASYIDAFQGHIIKNIKTISPDEMKDWVDKLANTFNIKKASDGRIK